MLTSQVHSACWIKQTQGHGIKLPTQRKLCFILSLFNQKITYLIGSLIDDWLKHSFYLTFCECFSLLQPMNT